METAKAMQACSITLRNLMFSKPRDFMYYKKTRLLLFLFLLFCSTIPIQAQTRDTTNIGSLKGKVKDSVYNFVLSSATVAVYKDADSSLLSFTIPNNLGEFTLQPLPIGIPLRLIITHTGFNDFFKKFTISQENKAKDLGWIYMHQADSVNTMEAVVIKSIAPVRMNGDTVEFNADAFRLNVNATAEDLMRKLPGFTIWGDGDITFNGKKINAVLVDGKPFMGGTDMTVATQNLPKDALDKIQVYQQRNDKNPLDSMLFANIKLKEDKKMGYFGKVSAAVGTDKRNSADGMLSGFNKKMQISTVAAENNINKIANSVEVLVKNASFKGVGANTDYQSDFSMQGLNKPVAAGARMQYDFITDVAYQKSSRLNADFFINRNNALINSATTTNTILGADSILSKKSINSNTNISDNQSFNTAYSKSTPKYSLNTSAALSATHFNAENEGSSQQEQTGMGIVSTSTSTNESKNATQKINLSAEYTNNSNFDFGMKHQMVPREFTVKYTFGLTDNSGSGRNRSTFLSNTNPSFNKEYDRLYTQKDGHSINQSLYAGYPRLKKLIFGRRQIGGIELGLSNTLTLTNGNYANKVLDLEPTSHLYYSNSYLTNTRNLSITDISPVLAISKSFSKDLTNRYSKNVSINVNIREQYYSLRHDATQVIQNIQYSYSKFVPDVSVRYFNHQYGDYEISSGITMLAKVNYPHIGQMAPLIDSANAWYIPMGNLHLKPEAEKDFSFNFRITSRKPKNPSEVQLNTTISYINDNITDSILYNSSGQQTVYETNLDGAKNLNSSVNYRKAFESKFHTFQLNAGYNYGLYHTPGYINSVLNVSESNNHNGTTSISYSYKDMVTLMIEQSLSYYLSEQKGFNNSKFTNNNQYTRFSGALQFPKNVVWSSNIAYNRSASNNSAAVNYTIWNSSLTYRFFKGNKGEVKFAAMDLLHQNKSILNITKGINQTIGYNNVLQQYFMLTLSYFPRKFGK